MKSLKKIIKSIIITLIIFFSLTLIITILNYFNILSMKLVNILSYIVPFISYFTGGYLLGKKSQSKGFLEGLKLGIVYILILLLINILLFKEFNASTLISYIIVLTSCIFGSILGINKKAI